MQKNKTVLVLGANSDVAKEAIRLYVDKGYSIIAASRSTDAIESFVKSKVSDPAKVDVRYFDAVDFESHASFYEGLPNKPNVVLYAAGFQVTNDEALVSWKGTFQMMKVHYCGAVSILNIIAMDQTNTGLERIVGLS